MTGVTQESYRFARAHPGVTMIVDYGFATAALGETDSRMLGNEAPAPLVMTGGFMAYIANLQTVVKIEDGIAIAQDTGMLPPISRTGTGTRAMRHLAGLSSIDKTGYVLAPDWDKVEAEAIRAGTAFCPDRRDAGALRLRHAAAVSCTGRAAGLRPVVENRLNSTN
ncbi:MAG: hypothetical protein DI564_10645 [Rhodanobacter denitrificans]|uniref:Uncharacterized protein n=1 Tax=Rhodanobacter denitrificans TaxID=666685 RepID=A0A2W5KD99_9GAMM|nr:MAG: hypothetical protein DI564_10645 [Rhodanobacter denitrificans]